MKNRLKTCLLFLAALAAPSRAEGADDPLPARGVLPVARTSSRMPLLPDPPWYEDRKDLLWFKASDGSRKPVMNPADWQTRASHIRASMEQVMGRLPPATDMPLDTKVDATDELEHYSRRHVTFVAEKGDRIPGWLLVPHGAGGKERLPGIVCLPGSSAPGKNTPAGLTSAAGMAYAHELACRGHVCLALDYPILHAAEYKTDPYALGYESATMKGIVNHRRGVDLLRSLPEVDPEAIGVIGHSLGGHNALFLAVFDPRVKAVVSSCGFNVFAKHNKGDVRAWSSRYYMPRIRSAHGDDPAKIPFDFTEVLAAIAPRPVFANAPLHDAPDFEVSGVKDCFNAALPVYQKVFGAGDGLVVRHPDAGHSFPAAERQAAYAFLERHLKPRGAPAELEKGLVAKWPAVAKPRDIPAAESPALGQGDFSLSMWARAGESGDHPAGDLISQYDPKARRGFHLTLKSNAGLASSQPNFRHLQFGIDDGRTSRWMDRGRPGKALLAFSMAVHEGDLYAGTCEPGKGESGRVYRHAGGQAWIDCGAPDKANSVTSMAVFAGKLHVGTGKYRLAGSSLPESENTNPGGRIFRYEGGTRWVDCGTLPGAEAVGGMLEFRGRLHASSLYKPAGFFRHEGGDRWTSLPVPSGIDAKTGLKVPKRVVPLAVHEGRIHAGSYDGGHVYRFDETGWTDLGRLGENTQTYSFARHLGQLHVGTWPSGRVYRLEGSGKWEDAGRLGEELEVMGMSVHNGRLIAGTLPMGETHQYEGGTTWKKLARLDFTPDVKYRRVWAMAEHDGQLFASTLPSGKVFSFSAGRQAARGHELAPGWHHVAAVKKATRLELHVDGELAAQTPAFDSAGWILDSAAPLRLGAGANGPFDGELADVRIYKRALGANDIAALSLTKPGK